MAQFKTVRLPFTVDTEDTRYGLIFSPFKDSETLKAEVEIEELIKEGWKIVSTSELLGSLSFIDEYRNEFIYPVTKGILVFMVKE